MKLPVARGKWREGKAPQMHTLLPLRILLALMKIAQVSGYASVFIPGGNFNILTLF